MRIFSDCAAGRLFHLDALFMLSPTSCYQTSTAFLLSSLSLWFGFKVDKWQVTMTNTSRLYQFHIFDNQNYTLYKEKKTLDSAKERVTCLANSWKIDKWLYVESLNHHLYLHFLISFSFGEADCLLAVTYTITCFYIRGGLQEFFAGIWRDTFVCFAYVRFEIFIILDASELYQHAEFVIKYKHTKFWNWLRNILHQLKK